MTDPLLKKKRNRNLLILLTIGVISICIRLLGAYQFHQSALLYVGIPFLVALALIFIERPEPGYDWKRRYKNLVILSLIIMLGSSVILFEGFVCVVMFMPIYFFILFLMFLFESYCKRKDDHRMYSHVLPTLIIISAFEGTIPEYSFEREYEVVRQKVIEASIKDIKAKLKQPMALDKSRHWILTVFPMPYDIQSGTLNTGDVHTINFRYHRWFVTNTHEGHMKLQLNQVEENYIQTKFIEDTSYISNYLKLHGTEIFLEPLSQDRTKVTLKIQYHRFLDPAWYFGPLQEYAIGKSSEFLLDEVITPDSSGA